MAYQFPKEIQEKLANFEQLKSQLQAIMSQKGEIEVRKKELDSSIDALKKRDDGDVFRRVGDILIKVKDTETLVKELEEESETLGVRIRSLSSQEKNAKEMYEKLANEINESIKG